MTIARWSHEDEAGPVTVRMYWRDDCVDCGHEINRYGPPLDAPQSCRECWESSAGTTYAEIQERITRVTAERAKKLRKKYSAGRRVVEVPIEPEDEDE